MNRKTLAFLIRILYVKNMRKCTSLRNSAFTILRELNVLPGFIISVLNLSNIRSAPALIRAMGSSRSLLSPPPGGSRVDLCERPAYS